jgi:hypothetical protein
MKWGMKFVIAVLSLLFLSMSVLAVDYSDPQKILSQMSSATSNMGTLASTATVSMPAKTAALGSTFEVNVTLSSADPVYAAQFETAFDNTILDAVNLTEGIYLKSDGASTFPVINVNNSIGKISFASSRFNTLTGVNGTGTIATITFYAKAYGTSNLALSNVIIADVNITPLPTNVINGTIKIDRPPVLVPTGNKTVNENSTLSFQINATDADGDTLTFSCTTPSGASFNLSTRIFSWTPNFTQAGTYFVTFTVSDGTLNSSETIKITVLNTNRAPLINSYLPSSLVLKTREGSSLQFNSTASDPDADPVTYNWFMDAAKKASGPSWLFSPTTADCGLRSVMIYVNDTVGASASVTWSVNVSLAGDVNGDRTVNVLDLARVGICFGQAPVGACEVADVNKNGSINIMDLATVGQNFGRSC